MRQSGNSTSRRKLLSTLAGFGLGSGLTLPGVARAADVPDFHFHPKYREQTPLDAAILKAKSGTDPFPLEKDHDVIAAILAGWSRGLTESPRNLQAIENSLAANFTGVSMRPIESKIIRDGPALEVRRIVFAPQSSLGASAFVEDLKSSLISFSKIITAEFQVAAIEANGPKLATRVRYEIIGTGEKFHREQRIGYWDLEWEANRVESWKSPVNETRSRAVEPCYADVSHHALGANSSYSTQLLHGVDYWRTVLDAASGIDIYGHNGVSVGDIDGDGFDDLYICQPAGLPNRLYRNRRDGTFEDITESSGVGILENTACALFVDVDNDGRQDLIVVRSSGPLLFLNQGGGKFRLKPEAFQFAGIPQGNFTGAAAADYDRDGWLDVYFCLYVYYQGAGQYKYPVPYHDAQNGPPNFLLRNNRDGTFRDVTAQTGLDKNNNRYSFCCGWNDYNNDGWPDLYVVNDFGRKNLYRNNADGTFTDVAAEAGVEDIGAGMSVAWFDYDNDGRQDLYSADMWTAAGERISRQPQFKKDSSDAVRALYRKHAMGNSLFRNTGKMFEDVTALSGTGIGRWAWSSDAWDFDHDGYPDLYIANGMLSGPIRDDLNSYFWRQVVANSPDIAKPSPGYEQGWNVINELIRSDGTWSGYERNIFYANNRDGTFSDVSAAVGLDFLEDGRAFALADFDHDGRQEILLKSRNAPQLRVLRNVMDPLPPAIAIQLKGRKSNPDAVGAAVTLECKPGIRETRMLQAGSGFLSQHSKELFFGLGTSIGPLSLSIRWPSGLVQRVEGIGPNDRIWIEEGIEQYRKEPFHARPPLAAKPTAQETERLPNEVETWLLAPIAAPDFSLPDASGRTWSLPPFQGKPALLTIGEGLAFTIRIEGLTHTLRGSDEVAAVYNILYRYLFDRHRDLTLPTSFLIDAKGDIVKIYQGAVKLDRVEQDIKRIPQTPADRLAKALPFRGVSSTYEFTRNHLTYGAAFFQRGYFEQADAFFRLAVRDDPASAEAQYGLGSACLKLDKIPEARAGFEQASKLPASNSETKPNAFNNLGLLATREGRINDAIGYFQQALRVHPEHLVALKNLGNAYRQQKRWDDARQTLDRALVIDPLDAEVHYSLAMVYAQTGDSARAYEYLKKALQLRPGYPEALNNLGVLYLRTERRDEAVAAFEECIRIAPAFDQSYLNLARVYSIEGHPEKARAVLSDLLKQRPDHAEARRLLEGSR